MSAKEISVGKRSSTTKELRSALIPWIITTLLFAIILILISTSLNDGVPGQILGSLGSASASISAALIITDYFLKPLYVRDILNTAKLSAEVYQSGLVDIKRLTKMDFSYIISGTSRVDIIGTPEMVNRIWPDLLDAASSSPVAVHVYLAGPLGDSEWRQFETSWKERQCGRIGSNIVIRPAGKYHSLLTIVTGSHCVVSASDGSGSSGNPLLFRFLISNTDSYVDSLGKQVSRMREDESRETLPFYTSHEDGN